MPAGESYVPFDTDNDGATVNGPVYFIKGINYTKDECEGVEPELTLENGGAEIFNGGIVYKGTYVYLDGVTNYKVPAGSYVFSNNDMYHLATAQKMKAFRFWIEELGDNASSSGLTFSIDGSTTAFRVVESSDTQEMNNVYNLCGQEVGNDINSLPRGIYVVKGKKVVIK